MKQIRTLFLVATLVTTLVPAVPAEAANEPTVTFFGGGFGHAIGMSQYGAYAMAANGNSADEILSFYYTGVNPSVDHTTLFDPTHPVGQPNPNIWVGLAQNVDSITFSIPSPENGGGPVDLCQANDGLGDCPRQDAVPKPGEEWELRRVSGAMNRCEFRRISPPAETFPLGDCSASVTWGETGLAEHINVNGTDYRYGTLRMRQGIPQQLTGQFVVSLDVSIEDYLLGLSEVPLSWPAAALEAQVVAARTYALEKFARLYDGTDESAAQRSSCYCHLYDNTFDQNYEGLNNEGALADYPDWQQAVQDTAGRVITYQDQLIQAFYSSSTGGFTENSQDVFQSPLDYAVSKSDPWSATSINKLATWAGGITVPVSEIEAALGFSQITNITLANPAPNAAMVVTGMKNEVETTGEYSISKRYGKLGLLSPSVSALTFNPDGGVGQSFAFTDISDSVHWENINKIAELRITLGCNPPDNTLFCPSSLVTRGQMAAFLTRALGLVDRAPDPFTDDDSSPFEADIEKIAAAGITVGCNPPANDLFCPDQLVTRAQMAAFLVRAFGFADRSPDPFVDDDGSIFEADIERLAAAGVTLGCNPPANDRYCPDAPVQRQHMASFLVRSINYTDG